MEQKQYLSFYKYRTKYINNCSCIYFEASPYLHILISTQCSFGILHKLEVSKNKALALSQEAWCHVYGLLQGASLGYELLAHVFAHLDILETDYFGLQYTDEKSVTRWIDQDKSIKKQTCKQRGGSLHVYF